MIRSEQVDCAVDKLPGESVAIFYFEDQKPLEGPAALVDWRLDGQLTRMLLNKEIAGRAGEHVMLQSNGKLQADWVLFVGGGKWHGLSEQTHAALVRHMLEVAQQAGFRDVSMAFSTHDEIDSAMIASQVDKALASVGGELNCCRFSCDVPVKVY